MRDDMCEPSGRAVSNRDSFERHRARPERVNNSVRRSYDLLRASLLVLRPRTKLVEGQLVDTLSASRTTVRAVLRLLADEGLITRRTRVGTTVKGSVVLYPVDATCLPDAPAAVLRDQILEATLIPAPAAVRTRLGLPESATVILIEGIVLQDDMPVVLWATYVDTREGDRDLLEAPFDAVGFMEERLRIWEGGSESTVVAIGCDAGTASILGVDEGAPVLWREVIWKDGAGTARALCHERYRGDRVALFARVDPSTTTRERLSTVP